MTATDFANKPAALTLDTIDAGGNPTTLTLRICRSLPAASAAALDDDLIAIGKRSLSPHSLIRPQLDALAKEAKAAQEAGDTETAAMLLADRRDLLSDLSRGLWSGEVENLAMGRYFEAGRKSVEGLVREIAERVRLAGGEVNLKELAAVITDGNAGLVLASLRAALKEPTDPTAAT